MNTSDYDHDNMMNISDYDYDAFDPCTQWVIQHNNSEGIPENLELEWMDICIGKQRYLS